MTIAWRLRFAEQARHDVDAVLAWTTERFGETQRTRYAALIAKTLARLRAAPAGPGIRAVDARRPGLKRISLGGGSRHYFVFRLEGDRIVVLRLLHSAMDAARHLHDDQGQDHQG